ncbi:MAG: hypothetical protein H6837_09840 [Planctomycetes bacterium]|nr:hypothetical protein [Planctomycetota bacterium]
MMRAERDLERGGGLNPPAVTLLDLEAALPRLNKMAATMGVRGLDAADHVQEALVRLLAKVTGGQVVDDVMAMSCTLLREVRAEYLRARTREERRRVAWPDDEVGSLSLSCAR